MEELDDDYEDEEDDEDDDDDEDYEDEDETPDQQSSNGTRPDFFNFGNSLTVQGALRDKGAALNKFTGG